MRAGTKLCLQENHFPYGWLTFWFWLQVKKVDKLASGITANTWGKHLLQFHRKASCCDSLVLNGYLGCRPEEGNYKKHCTFPASCITYFWVIAQETLHYRSSMSTPGIQCIISAYLIWHLYYFWSWYGIINVITGSRLAIFVVITTKD